MAESLTISLAVPASDREPRDLLQIEQDDWLPYTGVVTRAEMVRFVAAILYGGVYESRLECGLAGGAVVCAIRVYPRIPALAYQFSTSWGTLSERAVIEPEIEEIINFRLTDREEPSHPARSISSATWLAETYDSSGAVIPAPQLTIDGDSILAAVPVYGAVRVTYTTERHDYLLTAPRRDDAVDNHFSAVVYGVYDGGINWLEVEMPPGIEGFEADADADCGWGSVDGAITTPDDEARPVLPSGADRLTVVDYCSQTVVSDVTYAK